MVATSISRPVTDRGVRTVVALGVLPWIILTIGLISGAGWATWLWPWDDAEMTYVFFASITAAVAAPLAWLAYIDEPAALAGVTLDGFVIGTLVTLALLAMAISGSEWRLLIYAGGSTLFAISTGYVFRAFHPVSVRDTTPQPAVVRVVLTIVVALLVPLGIALMFRVDNLFPWDLPGHTSSVIGAMFLGASAYLAYGVWRNTWVHAGGPLAGLLAYDLILAVPYWRTIFDRDAMSGSGGYQSFPGQIVPG